MSQSLHAGEAIDSLVAVDSIALADSVARADGMHLVRGIMIDRPSVEREVPLGEGNTGMSWVLTGFILIFVIVCLRYRKHTRYLSAILNDITNFRERHNAFDDTLRETSFVWLLNVLWCAAAGVLLYGLLYGTAGTIRFDSQDVGRLGICIGMAAAFTLFLTLSYAVVGSLFADGVKASLWVKGYLATQGLEAILLFPVALLGLCVPSLLSAMIVTGAIIFILAKLLFIYKGFCIFFTEIASWVLFLYYLCSLEIVPIVLTYAAASYLCENV